MLQQISSRHIHKRAKNPIIHNASVLKKLTELAEKLLAEKNIRLINVDTEILSDEAETWVSRTFYIKESVADIVELNVELAERESELLTKFTENVVVTYMPAR